MGLVIFIIIFMAVLFLIPVFWFSKRKEALDRQNSINQKVTSDLVDKNFVASKIYYITDYNSVNKENKFKKQIMVDGVNKKIVLIDYELCSYLIISFKDFLGYELYEDGTTITEGAGIGGMGFGIFGASSSKSVKDFRLIIRINNIERPNIIYNIIKDTVLNIGLSKNEYSYRECLHSIQEVISFFEVIKVKNNKHKEIKN